MFILWLLAWLNLVGGAPCENRHVFYFGTCRDSAGNPSTRPDVDNLYTCGDVYLSSETQADCRGLFREMLGSCRIVIGSPEGYFTHVEVVKKTLVLLDPSESANGKTAKRGCSVCSTCSMCMV